MKSRTKTLSLRAICRSRPARGAWVEIPVFEQFTTDEYVAPRKGRVG